MIIVPRLAVVTGASSGIGEAYTRRLARDGMALAIVARREDLLEKLAAECTDRYGARVTVIAADLASDEGVGKVEEFLAGRAPVMLINNAGFSVEGSFLEADFERQLDMVRVHDIATMKLVRAVLPVMIERGTGDIINVSSMAGLLPVPCSVTYNSTKAFLIMFSESLARELAGTGVRVQALCPGYTHTGFHETMGADMNIPEVAWMSPEDVVDESLAALAADRVVVIPGAKNRLNLALIRALPKRASTAILWVLEKRTR